MSDLTESDDDLRREAAVQAWIGSANVDLAAARVLLANARDEIDPWVVTFHAQQSVEKSLKAWLLHLRTDFPPTHDINVLLDLLPADLAHLIDPFVRRLTTFAVAQRYPAQSSDPMALNEAVDWPEAEAAVGLAQGVIDEARRRIQASAADVGDGGRPA